MTPLPEKRPIKSRDDYLEYAEAFNAGNFEKYASFYADNMTRLCVDDHYVVIESYQVFRGQPGIQPQQYGTFGEISPGKGPVKHVVVWYRLNKDGLIDQLHLNELQIPDDVPKRSEDWDTKFQGTKSK
ncbi:hypothetical protein K469DRAFT_753500 [Zopfia rhizophila CBS 207.26]|uniref:SnoaL-like domain-containing protein n=1 Tax=Zopfia rhizophila CBS 207.26 TaxID=1314779 RepID=A0A6A6DMQ3_9PEZI|nr:hypothetical protein K469DRAFT_753500 [Zopfia rhizophila CBS 207.26]